MLGRPSPFPGIDPYLAPRWGDITVSVLANLCERLNTEPRGGLPAELRARNASRFVPAGASPAANEPGTITDRFIRIVDVAANYRVVTAITLLRTDNRTAGPSHDAYARRLRGWRAHGINVVELDLLRGPRAATPVAEPSVAGRPCLVSVWRADSREWACHPISLRAPLPEVSVPLRSGDADAVIALQPLVDRAYVYGAHGDIDYTRDPEAPLSPDDAAWADALRRAAGRR
jgi:hypothetical protein